MWGGMADLIFVIMRSLVIADHVNPVPHFAMESKGIHFQTFLRKSRFPITAHSRLVNVKHIELHRGNTGDLKGKSADHPNHIAAGSVPPQFVVQYDEFQETVILMTIDIVGKEAYGLTVVIRDGIGAVFPFRRVFSQKIPEAVRLQGV